MGTITAVYQSSTTYTPGATIQGSAVARVSVAAGGEATDFRLKMEWLADGALVDTGFAYEYQVFPGDPTRIFGGADNETVPTVLPPSTYTFQVTLEYKDPSTLMWVTLETKSKTFTLDD
jgi:hypothetical protein